MSLILKICGSDWKNASRDERELSVYREMGHDVAVLAKGLPADRGREETVDGFKVYRYTTRPFGDHCPRFINRAVSLFKWAVFAKKLNPDIISGHDLLPGLTIGWITKKISHRKIQLIYDSHEFEAERNINRSRFVKRQVMKWERFLVRRSAFSIMVNNSIAEAVQELYRLDEKPVVIRSTPNKYIINRSVCEKCRQEMLNQLSEKTNHGQGTKEQFLVMYHGALTSGRGIEKLIQLVSLDNNIAGIILGEGTETYVKQLTALAEDLNVTNRILFRSAVPSSELWKYVGAVDLSLMMIQNNAKSYYYSLPNKFFESIQALTPIVSSDFPEMKYLLNQYEIGQVCAPDNIQEIYRTVESIRTDEDLYRKYKANLLVAKEELCWEKEKLVLIDSFNRYIENNSLEAERKLR